MTHIHQYVPSVSYTEEKIVSGEKVMVTKERMHRLLIGGDQMTAARARSAIKSKINGETPSKKFEGLLKIGKFLGSKFILGCDYNIMCHLIITLI